MDRADEVVLVSDEDYKPYLMQIRNQWMTNRSDAVIAVWNGAEKGGTTNCVNYAKKLGKEITIINPNEHR